MSASTSYEVEFDVLGKVAATIGVIELVVGITVLKTMPRFNLMVSVIALAVILGSIVLLCVAAVPRRVQLPIIAGLMILFVITGAQVDLFDAASGRIAEHEAADEAPRIAPTLAIKPEVTAIEGASADSSHAATGSGDGGWAADLDVATSSLGPESGGVHAVVSRVVVDRTVEPNLVSFDWSIIAGADRKACGSISTSAADRQVALDRIAATVRLAFDRSRATGTATCY